VTKPARDAALATAALLVAVYVGSGRLAHLDTALLGDLGATVLAFAATVWRASAFWRRRPSAFYARAIAGALREPRRLRVALRSAGTDLVAQTFVARRSRVRWAAHVLLSLGTLASFAITVPLVLGWLRFSADGDARYRAVVFSVPTASFAVDGVVGWLAFHALSLAGVAVALGATAFLVLRWRARALDGSTGAFHTAPLLLLLAVALTGLALPAARHAPQAFDVAAAAHEVAVILLLAAIPFSKLHHVLVRPLQIGARLVRAPREQRVACAGCGADLAPATQLAAVQAMLGARGAGLAAHATACPSCRRRRLATAQSALVGAQLHPPLLGVRPAPPVRSSRAA
jgi:hypothetical protein